MQSIPDKKIREKIEFEYSMELKFVIDIFYTDQKYSINTVGKLFGVTGRTILNWMTHYNIATRGIKESYKFRRNYSGKNNPNYDRFRNEDERKLISEKTKEAMQKRGIKEKLSLLAKQKTGEKNSFYGRKHSEETKRKISEANLNQPSWNKGITGEEYYKHFGGRDVFIKNIMKGLDNRPTSFEQQIIDLCQEFDLPYKYVGDGSLIIGYKNPDFININGEKKIIEVYFTKWHPVNYEQQRTKIFAKYGFETIFLNETDLLCENWKEKCLLKVGI